MDIVGFEHAASTDDQKAAVEKAKARLEKPLGVFSLPAAAGCTVAEAKVAIEAEHDHDGDDDHDASTRTPRTITIMITRGRRPQPVPCHLCARLRQPAGADHHHLRLLRLVCRRARSHRQRRHRQGTEQVRGDAAASRRSTSAGSCDAAALPPLPAAADVVRMSGVRFRWPGARPFSLSIEDFALARAPAAAAGRPVRQPASRRSSACCAGSSRRSAGRLEVLGTDLTRLSNAARDRFRAEHFGIIFQMFNLLPYGSILDNVMLPLSFARDRRRAGRAQGRGRG